MVEQRLDPASLDLGLLALFVGQAAQDAALATLADAGFGDLRPSHGYLVQHLVTGPRTTTELADLQGISVQAVSKSVGELVTAGYVASDRDPSDGRARRLTLTERGWASVEAARRARRTTERRLVRALGTERADALRRDLVDALDRLGGTAAVSGRRVRSPR